MGLKVGFNSMENRGFGLGLTTVEWVMGVGCWMGLWVVDGLIVDEDEDEEGEEKDEEEEDEEEEEEEKDEE
jgi:hypothetical protein